MNNVYMIGLFILLTQSTVFAGLIAETKNMEHSSGIYILIVGFSLALGQILVFMLLGALALIFL